MKMDIPTVEQVKNLMDNVVVFHTDTIGSTDAPMVADEFHLPFPSMQFVLRKPYFLNGFLLETISVVGVYGDRWALNSPQYPDAQSFQILPTGEIVVVSVDTEKINIFNYETVSPEVMREMLIPRKEKYLYNFVYDVIATINHINNSEYVVTKHTTSSVHNRKLKNGVIERRIKIRRTKYASTPSTHKGTKHRYKYRVRGHYRQLEKEKIWIHDHVRGGDGTIFIPKEYEI
jgi:hypothetical protein